MKPQHAPSSFPYGLPRHHARRWLPWLGLGAVELATLLWGAANVVLVPLGERLSAPTLLTVRYVAATVVLLPWLIRWLLKVRSDGFGRQFALAILAGGCLGGAVWAQLCAMRTLPVNLVVFIMGLYVVFTPIASAWLKRRWPGGRVWLAVAASVAGVALMLGQITPATGIGLFWAVLAALGFTAQILVTSSFSQAVPAVAGAALQSLGAALVTGLAGGVGGQLAADLKGAIGWPWWVWLGLCYLAVAAQAGACLLQVWGQRHVSPTEAALAFNVEPVWTALVAWAALGEGLTLAQAAGGALLLGAVCIASWPGRNAPRD
jgi:drug/metabolite transporter (DMT)-like permease